MKDLKDSKELIARDLYEMAELLLSYKLVKDAGAIYAASQKVRTTSTRESWKYACNNLTFSINNSISGTIPVGVNYLEVIFNISIEGKYIQEKIYQNPVNALQFDIELHGLNDKSPSLYGAWHLDKHIFQAGDGPNKFIHPEFHFTFGGNKMELMGDVFGDCLIISSPRLAHPPMDAVLGIDFIIQNYVSYETRKHIVQDPRYRQLVYHSHLRLWRPYFSSLFKAWHEFDDLEIDDDVHHKKLLPFLT